MQPVLASDFDFDLNGALVYTMTGPAHLTAMLYEPGSKSLFTSALAEINRKRVVFGVLIEDKTQNMFSIIDCFCENFFILESKYLKDDLFTRNQSIL